MDKEVTIYCKNTKSYHVYPLGTSLIEILQDLKIVLKYKIVAARVNYKVEDLNFLIYKPKDIEFIDVSTPSGMRVYVRTLSMVMAKAVSELFPEATLCIEHPISKGYYCRIENLDQAITPEIIGMVRERMSLIISQGKKIDSEEKQTTEVKELFTSQSRQTDKVALFETIGSPYCRFFRIDDYIDYYNGVLLPSTDYLYLFDLVEYYDGILLKIPNRENPVELEEMVYLPKMHDIFKEYLGWNKILNLNNVGEFNIACRNNQSFNLIKVSEALHEKKVASIADIISQRSEKVRFVLISGPSSSGKTTFSKRLSVQLVVSGLKPVVLSLDNYFLNREDTPLDENGNWDFEHLHALDLDLFNQHLKQLLNGEEIEIPFFSFEDGKRYYKGETLRLKDDS
ncbi:MAG TPA: hypothetical protein VK152_06580, partial [Paludibacter sp.]|nr:hypothetical protein [Paludibacter sp.]